MSLSTQSVSPTHNQIESCTLQRMMDYQVLLKNLAVILRPQRHLELVQITHLETDISLFHITTLSQLV